MTNYRIQYKATVWCEVETTTERAMEKFKHHLISGNYPDQAFADTEEKYPTEISYVGVLEETEEFITPENNGGQPTVEIFIDEPTALTKIWTNEDIPN